MKEHTSIITDDWEHCILCGGYPDHEHHCLHGSYKELADKFHLVAPLCHNCHEKLHDKSKDDKKLQAKAQEAFEEHYPELDFLKIFGRNFK